MIKCPLASYGKQYCFEAECMGEDCMLWSRNEDTCLIRLALLKYTTDNVKIKLKTLENLEKN